MDRQSRQQTRGPEALRGFVVGCGSRLMRWSRVDRPDLISPYDGR